MWSQPVVLLSLGKRRSLSALPMSQKLCGELGTRGDKVLTAQPIQNAGVLKKILERRRHGWQAVAQKF
jgi:hypothetical protein